MCVSVVDRVWLQRTLTIQDCNVFRAALAHHLLAEVGRDAHRQAGDRLHTVSPLVERIVARRQRLDREPDLRVHVCTTPD